jgi:hypothetical protein
MRNLRARLTYANVMATIAVFVALGGASYAATQLPKNSVGTKQLKKNAVTTAKIKNGAVTGAKVNLSSLGTVPNATHATSADSASHADTAGDAGTLQGNPASAFMQGGGRFFSTRRELALGDSEVTLFTLPRIGPVTASCSTGTTFPKGGFKVINDSSSTLEQTLQYSGGVDGGTALPGESIGFGGGEYVDSVTVQVATRSPQPVVATLNLSFLKTDANTGCDMIGQATLTGG